MTSSRCVERSDIAAPWNLFPMKIWNDPDTSAHLRWERMGGNRRLSHFEPQRVRRLPAVLRLAFSQAL